MSDNANFLQIPGNIKQRMLPFVLNNDNANICKQVNSSPNVVGPPQLFSFRDAPPKNAYPYGQLNIIPSSYKTYMSQDIGNLLLYGNNKGQDMSANTEGITLADIFKSIPGVQIREFLPDTKLDQAINFISGIIESVMSVFFPSVPAEEESNKDQKAKIKVNVYSTSWFARITNILKFILKYMTGSSKPHFYNTMDKVFNSAAGMGAFTSPEGNNAVKQFILQFPYLMYYRLQSFVTTNIYEIPGVTQDKALYSSDGDAGWGAGGARLSEFGKNIPKIGPLINELLSNVGINWTPWWNAAEGTKVAEPQVNIKFDLFNDTSDAALYNFIFVNTIVPNNKWIQYNLFQHSSCLYDIKLEGYNRLFACSGKFSVKYDGVLRDPPKSWIETLTATHCSKSYKDIQTLITNNQLIKIPDVYHVEMTFTSLLPANFNNYLFTIIANDDIKNKFNKADAPVYESSILNTMLSGAITGSIKDITEQWNTFGLDEAASLSATQAAQNAYDNALSASIKKEKDAADAKAAAENRRS